MSVFARTLVERVRATHAAVLLARRLGEEQLAELHEADLTDLLRIAAEEGLPVPAFGAWP